MLLSALVLSLTLSAKTAGAVPTLANGDSCTASVPLKLFLKKKPVPIAKGTEIKITALKGTLATVSAGGKTGDMTLKDLQRKCAKVAAKAKDDVTLDMGAGPIVKTEKQAEVAVVQHAASQPSVATTNSEEQVELTLPSGRAATLIYTPILNGGGPGVDAVLPSLDRRLPQVLASIQSFGTRAGPSVAHLLDAESKRCRVDDACLARIGKKLKADAVLAGVLTLNAQGNYRLEFRLIDPKSGKATDHNTQEFANQGLQPLIDHSIDTVRVAVRELIVEEYGRLALRVSEPRTQVRIDTKLVGLTPIVPRPLSPGEHTLDLQLEDFRPFSQKVTINPLEDVTLNIALERTPEFVATYKKHAMLVRNVMWGMVGVGALGVAGGVGFYVGGTVINNNAYNKYEKGGRRLNDTELKAVANANHQVDIFDALAVTAAVVGVLGLGTAAVLYLAGDDPYKYDHPGQAVSLHLSFGPGSVALNGSF